VAFADVPVNEAVPPFTVDVYDTLIGKQMVTVLQNVSAEHTDDAMTHTVYVPFVV
jgi:hypothetical protein